MASPLKALVDEIVSATDAREIGAPGAEDIEVASALTARQVRWIKNIIGCGDMPAEEKLKSIELIVSGSDKWANQLRSFWGSKPSAGADSASSALYHELSQETWTLHKLHNYLRELERRKKWVKDYRESEEVQARHAKREEEEAARVLERKRRRE